MAKKKPSAEELDVMTKEDLYALAQTEEVEGRSTMDRDQLCKALKEHYGYSEPEQPGETAAGSDDNQVDTSKEAAQAVHKTEANRTVGENIDAGGHPTGRVPGGTT